MDPATKDAAFNAYRNIQRFNAVCQGIVAQVMAEHDAQLREVEHSGLDAQREAYRIAIEVAAMVLQTVYENDTEIRAWKAQAEKLMELHMSQALFTPHPMLISARGLGG